MQPSELVVHITTDMTPRPAVFYAATWCPGTEPDLARERICDWCRRGKVPGAYKGPDGAWWVKPLVLINWELPGEEEASGQTTKSEGDGLRRDRRAQREDGPPCPADDQWPGDLRPLEERQR